MNIFSQYPVFTISLIAAVIGGALVLVVRRFVPLHLLTLHHEVALPMFLQLGVIYAVLLAFIFSFMLSDTNEAYIAIKKETTNLLTLAQLAPGFPPAMRQEIDEKLLEYTQVIIEKEWPKMAKRQEEPAAQKLLRDLEKIYINFSPQPGREQVIYAESLSHLSTMRENRRTRIFTATELTMKKPWIFLGLLGGIVVAISYFFGMKHLWTQMFLTGALVFTITSILTLMIEISHPFEGPYAIKTRVFELTLIRLQQIIQE